MGDSAPQARALAKTVAGALLGAAVGWMLFTMTDSGLARR